MMRWLLALVLVLTMSVGVQATTLQALLVRATNDSPSDAALKELQPQLKRQFGYPSYRLLGSKHEVLKPKTSSHMDVGEGFVVKATLKSSKNHIHELDIQWLSGKTKLMATTVKMSEGSHVLVKGPGVGNDWIVLALSILP